MTNKPSTNFIWVGYLASAIYFIVDIYQYWIKYPDTNIFLENLAIAFLLFGVSFLYDRYKKQEWQLDYIEEKMEDKYGKEK